MTSFFDGKLQVTRSSFVDLFVCFMKNKLDFPFSCSFVELQGLLESLSVERN